MKTMIGLMMVVMVAGCAGNPPVWQQELNNLHRYHRTTMTAIEPNPAGAKRPNYGITGLQACGINQDYR